MYSKFGSIFLSLVLVFSLVVVQTGAADEDELPDITDECRNLTIPLLTEPNLAIAQQIILEDYTAAYNDVCDIGLASQECDIKFEGDDRTYRALCEDVHGGQLYKRNVELKCLLGAFTYDLGYIPTCVSNTCNVSRVEPGDVVTEQVQTFLDNLTFTGCTADASGASITTTVYFVGGWSWQSVLMMMGFAVAYIL